MKAKPEKSLMVSGSALRDMQGLNQVICVKSVFARPAIISS